VKVLILASREDGHAQVVAQRLAELNAAVDFFTYDEFVVRSAIDFSLGQSTPKCLFQRQEGELDLLSYGSIWFRRPGRIAIGRFEEYWINDMVESETRSALDGIMRTIDCLWMNYPPNDTTASSKIYQLKVASQLGFDIPETLVTNRAELVRNFFEQCDGEVIYKLIGNQTAFNIPTCEAPNGIATLPLRAEDIPYLNQVTHAPHLFQRRIRKQCELRVTVVGKEIFCISIDSQSGQGKIDWRLDYSVEMEKFELPKSIKDLCFALLKKLGLNYGAIDLIKTDDDRYVFLEINPAGQYMWIEERTDLPISIAIANLLARKTEPLVESPNH
jgi:glutathione synthase/RimK-type ligase-like ATP-grasp enzyme